MDHATTTRRLYELINAGNIDGFGDLLADDFVEHEELPGLAQSKDGVKTFFRGQIAAFPDLRMTVEDLIADGSKAVARVRYTGTQHGEFNGMPPSGKAVDVQLVDIFAFADDGRVNEHWGVIDLLTMMQQLGVVPSDPVG